MGLSKVQSFDLEDTSTRTCEQISDYPRVEYGNAVGVIGDVIKSCGGATIPSNACYDYYPTNNTWVRSTDMLSERWYHGHSFIDKVWLLSGGNSNQPLSTTEIWNGNTFEVGPPLPRGMYAHCQLTVNHTHVFFATIDQQPSYLLYWPDLTWTELPPLTKSYSYPSCGLINNPDNGLEAVFMGETNTEIFSFMNLTWRDGPPLTYVAAAGSAQLSDTFIIAGGQNAQWNPIDTIYKFDHINYQWVLQCRHLQNPAKFYPGVVTVPDNFVNCTLN